MAAADPETVILSHPLLLLSLYFLHQWQIFLPDLSYLPAEVTQTFPQMSEPLGAFFLLNPVGITHLLLPLAMEAPRDILMKSLKFWAYFFLTHFVAIVFASRDDQS